MFLEGKKDRNGDEVNERSSQKVKSRQGDNELFCEDVDGVKSNRDLA